MLLLFHNEIKPKTLLSKLQSHASPDQALIQEEVKDSGGTIIHQFNAVMFALVVKPALSCLSKNLVRVISGHKVSLPHHPDHKRDKQGLLVSIKMDFLVEIPDQQPRKVVLHLYATQTKLMTQGSSTFPNSPGGPRLAHWFVINFVFPSLEDQVKKSGTSTRNVSDLNKAILKLQHKSPSNTQINNVSSLQHLPSSSFHSGANVSSVTAQCAACEKLFDGRTKAKETCDHCRQFFHVKCIPRHRCAPLADIQYSPATTVPAITQPQTALINTTSDMASFPSTASQPLSIVIPTSSHQTDVAAVTTTSVNSVPYFTINKDTFPMQNPTNPNNILSNLFPFLSMSYSIPSVPLLYTSSPQENILEESDNEDLDNMSSLPSPHTIISVPPSTPGTTTNTISSTTSPPTLVTISTQTHPLTADSGQPTLPASKPLSLQRTLAIPKY